MDGLVLEDHHILHLREPAFHIPSHDQREFELAPLTTGVVIPEVTHLQPIQPIPVRMEAVERLLIADMEEEQNTERNRNRQPHKVDRTEHRMTEQIPPRDLKVVDKSVTTEITENP
jgi:hypothetical protein